MSRYVNPKRPNKMVLNEVLKKDEGRYTCAITNALESANATARLTVLGKGSSTNHVDTQGGGGSKKVREKTTSAI